MLESLQSLFSKSIPQNNEVDIKYFVQNFLRHHLKSDAVYCDRITKNVALVRVASPALQQAATLLEYDLIEDLQKEAEYKLEAIKVRVE